MHVELVYIDFQGHIDHFKMLIEFSVSLEKNGSERTASALKGVGITVEGYLREFSSAHKVVSKDVAWMPFELTFLRRSFAAHCGLIAQRALLP